MNKTIEFYNDNADEFVVGTVNADMTQMYEMFLKYLHKNDVILDLGCGSGRDSKYFIKQGYRITAIDGSSECCKLAKQLINQDVECLEFNQIKYISQFDGVWACASLLHIPKSELCGCLKTILMALKDNGIMYASFKYGDFEGYKDGRYFTNFTENSFAEMISEISEFKVIETQVTGDVRNGRESEKWINIILTKITKNV